MRISLGIIKNEHGVYSVRKKVPKALEHAVAQVLGNGKARQTFLKETLGTKDKQTAKVRSTPILMKFDRIIAEARALLADRPIRESLSQAESTRTRVTVLQSETSLWRGDVAAIQAVAGSFGVTLLLAVAHDDDEITRAITELAHSLNGGSIVLPNAYMNSRRDLIVALSARHGVPAIYSNRGYIAAHNTLSAVFGALLASANTGWFAATIVDLDQRTLVHCRRYQPMATSTFRPNTRLLVQGWIEDNGR
jgi:hypothetical protein